MVDDTRMHSNGKCVILFARKIGDAPAEESAGKEPDDDEILIEMEKSARELKKRED